MVQKSWNKERAYRVLRMYDLLQRGEGISKTEFSGEFCVSEKSIQRDVELLNQYIDEYCVSSDTKNIAYQRDNKLYLWKNRGHLLLNQEEIVLLATILLESRSLPKGEIEKLLKKMTYQCSKESAERIWQLIKNEVHHYAPVRHGKVLGNLIWSISEVKQKQLLLEIDYLKVGAKQPETLRVKPLGIMFSEFYFYLLAHNEGEEQPQLITYRIDRIENYKILLDEHYQVIYRERFQEGEFRQQVQFMSTGKLLEVKFRFWGKSLEAVQDRLPNAKIIAQDEQGTVLTARVFGKGIKMWFLSQAEFLEVLEPEEFRLEMKTCIEKMAQNYRN